MHRAKCHFYLTALVHIREHELVANAPVGGTSFRTSLSRAERLRNKANGDAHAPRLVVHCRGVGAYCGREPLRFALGFDGPFGLLLCCSVVVHLRFPRMLRSLLIYEG
jgi:hypothetical protein